MKPLLRNTIAVLAAKFADDIVHVISASLSAHLRPSTGASPGRRVARAGRNVRGGRVRRSAAQLAELADRIVTELGRRPDGARAEELRVTLKLPRSAIARPMAQLLAERRVRKTGQKRRTTYFVSARRAKGGAA